MRVAVIGRTRALLRAAELVLERGHTVPVVWTARAEAHYGAGPTDFARLASRAGAVFVERPPLAADRLRSFGCDIALSVNWPTVIPAELLAIPPHGFLNAHAGDLPRYRGNACPNWAILNGEPHVGLCLHQMAPELDAGPLVLRDRMALTDQTYIGDVYDWLESRVPVMLADAVDGLESGALIPEPQPVDTALSLRCYPRRPEDARIDWSAPVDRIMRLVRASSRPFAGAFTTLEGARRVTVWRAVPVEHPGPFLAVPGQVCARIDGDPVIAADDGMVRLTEAAFRGQAGTGDARSEIARSLRSRLI